MRRLAGAAFIAFLILAVAVTPLLATFRPASFDLKYIVPGAGVIASADVMNVTLEDQSGLVTGFDVNPDATASPAGIPTRLLVVSWDGACSNPDIYMRFIPAGDGYLLVERTSGDFCEFLNLTRRAFSMALRAPLDPASVQVVHE